jgi:hypothetical protein
LAGSGPVLYIRSVRRGETIRFPTEAVRDLLGIVRALYAAAKEADAGSERLRKIARVGEDLRRALDLASGARPGTLGHSAAWRRAERATKEVADLVDALTPAEPLVRAARERVAGASVALRKKRPER